MTAEHSASELVRSPARTFDVIGDMSEAQLGMEEV
jgi:hypothetical protein